MTPRLSQYFYLRNLQFHYVPLLMYTRYFYYYFFFSFQTQELKNTQHDEIQSEILSNEDSSNTPVEPSHNSRDTVTPVFPPRQKPSGKRCPSASQLDEIESEPVRTTRKENVGKTLKSL